MKIEKILSCVDHTLLKPTADWTAIEKLCQEAISYKTASVCIPPCYIERVKKRFDNQVDICTVIGFPLGYSTKETKVFEAQDAIDKGALEVDMVINMTDVKNGDFEKILDEIRSVKNVVGEKILKVIIETCYLTEEEKIHLSQIVTESGADYIKTSTGFGTGGATLEDVKLLKTHIGTHVKVKASGGIRTKKDMEKYLEEGCSRLGTSSAVELLKKQG